MSRSLSSYLDFLRFFAALVVLLHHASPILFPGVPLPFPGHHAVILFFFISGFVIAHVSSKESLSLEQYSIDRLLRLLSVAIPALALSLCVFVLFGSSIGAIPASKHLGVLSISWEPAVLRTILNAVFMSQVWWIDAMAPFNGVFWSLSYEFWYYLIFAAWHFSPRSKRVWLALAATLLAGPRIILLLPCWLAGVWVYRNLGRWNFGNRIGTVMFVATSVSYLLVFWFDIPVRIRDVMDTHWPVWMSMLGGSRNFVGDSLLAVLFALNCLAFASMDNGFTRAVANQESHARFLGSYTFSLYAFHTPLLAVCLLMFANAPRNFGYGILILAIIIGGVMLLALITEHKRQYLKNVLTKIIGPNRLLA